jgi:hypothetical protein
VSDKKKQDKDDPVKIDKQGRIIDKQGRPLRDHRSQQEKGAPFHGKPGKPGKRFKHLEDRIKTFEGLKNTSGMRRPGSMKK